MDEETQVTGVDEAPQPKAEETPLSLSERIEKSVTEQWQRAATEESASEPEAAAEEATEQPAGSEQRAEGTTETAPEKFEVTPEQLADTKFWGGLDKAGWERMQQHYPVATQLVKAAQAAGTRIVNEARRTAPPTAETANEKPTEAQPSPELMAAIQKANSMNDKEAAEGLQKVIELTLESALPKFGVDPAANRVAAMEQAALKVAIEEMPVIASYSENELVEAIKGDPALVRLVGIVDQVKDERARVEMAASIIMRAGQTVAEQRKGQADSQAATKQAEIDKKKNVQRKVNSNASIPSSTVAESPSGGAPKGRPTIKEFVEKEWAKVAGQPT